MKCSGDQASARANSPGSVRRASAMTERGEGGAEQESPFEHEVRRQASRRAGGDPEHPQDHGGSRAHNVKRPARPGVGLAARRRDEGKRGARHEVEQSRVGAEVDPGGIGARVKQDRHHNR